MILRALWYRTERISKYLLFIPNPADIDSNTDYRSEDCGGIEDILSFNFSNKEFV